MFSHARVVVIGVVSDLNYMALYHSQMRRHIKTVKGFNLLL